MASHGSKKKRKMPVFESIRKPLAPPTRKMEPEKPEEKVHPAGRGSKYRPRDGGERLDD